MNIQRIETPTKEMVRLWEENLGEPWHDYTNATQFVQYDEDGKIIAGFAVYYDNSDGVAGNYISGWSARKNLKSVESVINYLAGRLGEIYIKTDKRQMKIISGRLGELVKKSGSFCYYIIKG
jgi:hypothetical protein